MAGGFLDIPILRRRPWGILVLVLNVLPPGGIGTIIAGIKGRHTITIILGVVQLALAVFILGYIWSIVWGITLFRRSRG